MSYFKLKNNGFKIFIKNSKAGFMDQAYESNFCIPNVKELIIEDVIPPYIKKIIMSLEDLTREDKIIWNVDFEGFFRGVVIKDCRFSNFKIILENTDFLKFDEFGIGNLNDLDSIYRISLIKDTDIKNSEYVINIKQESDEMVQLVGTVAKKILQQSN